MNGLRDARPSIEYRLNREVSVAQFVGLLERSGLAERRPMSDLECLQGMLAQANLTISAWCADELIGIARCVTDFYYCCYLSDLAVDASWQGLGVGRELQRLVKAALKPSCKLILIAAPKANDYYPKLGFENNPRCWVSAGEQPIS